MAAHPVDRRGRIATGMVRVVLIAALVLVDLVATALVTGPSVAACSCAELATVESAIAEGDAAFVGAAADRRRDGSVGSFEPEAYTFDVTEVVNGDLPARIDVWTGEGGGDCGVVFEVGKLVGVVLRRDGDRWTTSICGGVWLPDELRSPHALPAPTGHGPVTLLATGRTGEAVIASFDAAGGLAAWGLGGAGDELIDLRACPGSTTVVGMAVDRAGATRVVHRSVATLADTGSVLLPARDPEHWPQLTDNRGFQCTSPDGDVAFLVSAIGYGDEPADNMIVRVAADVTSLYPVDHAWDFAVAPDLGSAYLLSGADGTTLERFMLDDGSRRVVTELPDGLGGRSVAADGATGRIAVVATTNPTLHARGDPAAPDDRLVVLDAGGVVLTVAALAPSGLVQGIQWLGNDRLLVVWSLPSQRIDVVGLDGAVHSSFAPDTWASGRPAVVDDRLYLATEDGVISLTLDGGDARPLALSIARVRDVVAVIDGPVAAPVPTPTIPSPPATAALTTPATTARPATTAAPATSDATGPVVTEPGDDGRGVAAAAGVVVVVAAVGAVALVRRRRRPGAI